MFLTIKDSKRNWHCINIVTLIINKIVQRTDFTEEEDGYKTKRKAISENLSKTVEYWLTANQTKPLVHMLSN